MTEEINRRISEHWDREARLWAEVVRGHTDIYREGLALPAFLELLGDVRGKEVLDMACGEGSVTRELARRGAKMTAVDLSAAMIELALEEEKRESLHIAYHVANSAKLKALADESFDDVVCFMAVMDIAGLDGTFEETARTLRKDGRFVFNVPHPCFQTRSAEWIYEEDAPRTDKSRLHFAVDHYFDRGSIEERVTVLGLSPEPLHLTRVRFHRTLEDYVRSLRAAGLFISDLRESIASKEMVRKFPELDRSRRIPYFLLVEARKLPGK
jgi:2-polyprenyl-3-methyl-5-hydroxy-6-metoxy-1,4-benzoquinol methylase